MSTDWNKQDEPITQPIDWVGDQPPGEKYTIYEMDYALIQNLTIAQIDAMTLANSNPTAWTAPSEVASTWETE